MADYDIGEAFRRIEEIMIDSMARNLRHHINLEQDEGINYTQWQAEQLAALRSFQKQNSSLFDDYFSTIDSQIDEVLRRAYATGEMEQEISILEALKKGWTAQRTPSSTVGGEFFRKNERKLNALIKATQRDMRQAETAMLRMANDQYRKVLFNSHVFYQSGAGTLSQCVDMATKDFLARGINCIEYANGTRVGIDAYAAMALRTAHTRAYLQGEAAKRDEWGINTVIVNKRGVACPRCLKYVGKVFYDDVWGTVPVKDNRYPRLSAAIRGGLYHPNCKDIHTTYFEGVNTPPQPMTKEQKAEAERVYALEQEQRYNERQIRHWKRLESGSVCPENQKNYRQHRESWQERQRQFISDNGDVLKRRYENERYSGMKLPEPPRYSQMVGETPPKHRRIVTPKERRATPEEITVFTSQLEQYGVADVAGFEKYRGERYVLDGLVEAVSKLSDDFAEDVGRIKLRYSYIGNQGAFAQYDPAQATITLNSYYFDASDFLEAEYNALVAIHHFPQGTDYKSALFHEFGHQVAIQHSVHMSKILREAYIIATGDERPSMGKIMQYLLKNISKYSMPDNGDFNETIAEAFSMWYNSNIKNRFCEAVIKLMKG